jgi:hypothetical protein
VNYFNGEASLSKESPVLSDGSLSVIGASRSVASTLYVCNFWTLLEMMFNLILVWVSVSGRTTKCFGHERGLTSF